jgi:integrase
MSWLKDSKHPYLRLHPKTGVWYVRKKKRGRKPLFASTGETAVMRARTSAERLIYEWESGSATRGRTFGDVCTEAMKSFLRSPKLKKNTKYYTELYCKEMIARLGHYDVTTMTRARFEGMIDELRAEGGRKTFGDYAKHFNKVMRYAYDSRYVTHLVTVENPDPKTRAGRVYTDEEFAGALAVAEDPLYVQLLMGHDCMMRLREILYLERKRVNLETGLVTLEAEHVKTGSKTGKGRSFYVTEEVRWLLHAADRKAGNSPYFFPSPKTPKKPVHDNKRAWATVKRRAGIMGRARFHDTRHSGLTRALLVKRINPLLVSQYAGVSLKTIERVYLHVKPEHTAEVASLMGQV